MKIAFIHRGSETCRKIIEETGFPRWGRGVRADVIVNYGVAGERLEDWRRKNPRGSRLAMVNEEIGLSKFEVLKRVRGIVEFPESGRIINIEDDFNEWLVKPDYSCGGRGIELAVDNCPIYMKYYQKRVMDRRYELRVHGFGWVPEEEWVVQKRVGDADELTWNHKTGGGFKSIRDMGLRVFVEAKDMAGKVMKEVGMDFGASDFIVDEGRKVWFIEINAAPGVKELSLPIYVRAFERLGEMEVEEFEERREERWSS